MQRAAHVQLHVLAVRGQGLQTVRGGARLHTRGARGPQAFGRSRRRARGLGRHASERTRVAVEGSLRAPDRFPETPRLQRRRPTARRTRPLATATPRRPPAAPSRALSTRKPARGAAQARPGRGPSLGAEPRTGACAVGGAVAVQFAGSGCGGLGRVGNRDGEGDQGPFAPCSSGRRGPQPVTVSTALHSRERKQTQRLKVEHGFPSPAQCT